MATIGNLVIDITGNMSGLRGTLSKAQKAIGGFTGGVKGAAGAAFSAVGTAAVAGTALAGAAVIGLGAAGTKAFVGFENSMNEVFTLLPGLSQDAMDAMSGDVLKFSKDFGALPDEVVPALYQAISAGVPKDNVFDFLETAQKAAVGGVTDLSTAIDGITSVVNAYGEDVIGSGEASDLMFTAVKNGKTTFDELSNSLYNVIPTAASMGVGFGDITAAMATMTAQGVPTSVATTQMRQMLVELGKSGTKTSDAFKEVAGVGFAEFIAQGGNVQGALGIMQQAADENGLSLADMFGSVEAGSAALALTGANADAFAKNVQDMAGSAGATEAAYTQMDGGMQRSFDRIKAGGSAMLIQVGEALSPLVSDMLDRALPAFERFGAWFSETGAPAIQAFAEKAGAWIGDVLMPAFERFGAWFSETGAPAIQAFISGVLAQLIPGLKQLAEWGKQLADAVLPSLSKAWDWITNNMNIVKPILIGIGVAILALASPVTLIIAGIVALGTAWANNWGGIREKTAAVVDWFNANVKPKLQAIFEWITDTGLPALKNTWETVWGAIQAVFERVFPIFQAVFDAFKSAFHGDWYAFGEKLREAWDGAWNLVINVLLSVGKKLLELIVEAVNNIITFVKDTDWGAVGRAILEGMANGIKNGVGLISNAAKNAAKAALDAAKGFLGIHSPSAVFKNEVGGNIVAGLVNALDDGRSMVSAAMSNLIVPPPELAVDMPSGASGELISGSVSKNTVNITINASNAGDAQRGVMSALRAAGLA